MATKRYNAGIQRAKGLLEIAASLYDTSLSQMIGICFRGVATEHSNYPDDPVRGHVPQPQAANSENRLAPYPHIWSEQYPMKWSYVNSIPGKRVDIWPWMSGQGTW